MNSSGIKRTGRRALCLGLSCALAAIPLAGCSQSEPTSNEASSAESDGSSTESVKTKWAVSDLFSERDLDASYNESTSTRSSLTDEGSTADGSGVEINGSEITITREGTYIFSGSLSDGRIVVDAAEEAKVQLVLDGVSIATTQSCALYVRSADKVFLTQADGSTNSLTASGEDHEEDEHNLDGAVWSHEDFTINGSGSLEVTSACGHGIAAKDDLSLASGTISVNSKVDALQAKGVLAVNDGAYKIVAGDDGMHSDTDLIILGGTIDVAECYEGLEGATVTVQGGNIQIVASDDGVNASGTSQDDSEESEASTEDIAQGEMQQPAGNIPSRDQGGGGMDQADESAYVLIAGGTLKVSAESDGIDSNGSLTITGGETYVSGPTNDGNGALDYAGTAAISGGIVVAAGPTGMAQGFSDESTQGSALITLAGNAGDTIEAIDSTGNGIASYSPTKAFSCVVISAPGMTFSSELTVTCNDASVSITLDKISYSDMSAGMAAGNQTHQEPEDPAQPGDATERNAQPFGTPPNQATQQH